MHSHLIARKLKTRGFNAKVVENGVAVSLIRQISIQEVKDALSLSFEEIELQVTKISVNQVLVKE